MSSGKAKSKDFKSESITKETEQLKRNMPKGDVTSDVSTDDDSVKKF